MSISARYLASVLAMTALVSLPATLDAQTPIRVGLGGGLSMPVGDIAKTSMTGINLSASLTYEPRRLPFGFELGATYHNFVKSEDAPANSFVMAATGGITIPITGTIGKPYLMLGGGYYNTQGPTTGEVDAERDLGAYGGVGIRFQASRVQFDVKAAFHEIFADRDTAGRVRSRELIPISISVIL
jgi:hypothetical protein